MTPPNKISQPEKDYNSAVTVKSSCVKGERQVTKVIHKMHLHNAKFNNPDTKNNLTIPVTVEGQALKSKSNPV